MSMMFIRYWMAFRWISLSILFRLVSRTFRSLFLHSNSKYLLCITPLTHDVIVMSGAMFQP